MSRDYLEFEWGSRRIFVAIDPPGDKQNSVKHLIIVENGRAEVLTAWETKTVPDVVDLVERSIRA
jgi:hypothetical protein